MTKPSPIARKIIHTVQKKKYDELGWLPPQANLSLDELKSVITPRYFEDIKELSTSLPEYEDPTSYWHLKEVINDIQSVSGRLGVNLDKTPLPATLPLGDTDAMTVMVPATGERIIFLDSGLVMFASIMAGAISRALPTKRTEDGKPYIDLGYGDPIEIGDRLAAVNEAREAITRATITYAAKPQPYELLQLLMSEFRRDESQPTTSALLEGALDFAVGHEYGHIVKGESSHDDPNAEMAADAFGATLSTAAMLLTGGHGLEMATIGADFHFSCRDLVHRTVSMLRYGDERHLATSTHPDPATRRNFQRTMMEKNPDKDAAHSATVFGKIIERMLTTVWESMRPEVVALRNRGVPASKVWKL